MRWGGTKYGWNNLHIEDVKISRGPLGRVDVVLADNSAIEDENTDILLHFDRCGKDKIFFSSNKYSIDAVNIFPSEDIKKFGDRSAGFLYYQNTIRIRPLDRSLFLEKGPLQSFTIDFFLFPTSVHDGTVVFSWHGPTREMDGEFTGIKAYFKDGRLFWIFENVFQEMDAGFEDVLIAERSFAPVNEWHHHALHYNSDNGLLTLYYDGRESNLKWITKGWHESGTRLLGKFLPYLAAPISIGDSFLGYFDEFRISRGLPDFFIRDYKELGEIRSEVIELDSKGTKLIKFLWESIEEKGTAVRLFYRISDTFFLPDAENEQFIETGVNRFNGGKTSTELQQDPAWVQVKKDAEISAEFPSGKYLQWRAELYGTEGLYTPYLLSIKIMLELDLPPSAPTLLKVKPLNQGVRLLWAKNRESDILGYKVYYGESSKFYFGMGSRSGDSPVFAGNGTSIVLKGLKNEKVYFFSVTAVDITGQESGFSREMIVRPSSIHGDE